MRYLFTLGLVVGIQYSNPVMALAPSVGQILNESQNQFPSIYLPSVGYRPAPSFTLIESNEDSPKLSVEGVTFSGNDSISDEALQTAFAPYVKRELSPKQVYALTDLIKYIYEQNDQMAVATVPKQDVSAGIVRFDIRESTFDGVELDHAFEDHFNVPLDRIEAIATQDTKINDPIILSEIRRGHLLAIDLHGVAVSGGIHPSSDNGQQLELWVENSDRVVSELTLDNQAKQELGSVKATLNTLIASPTQRGGAAYFSAIKSEGLSYASLAYRGPAGLRGATFDLQFGRLDYTLTSNPFDVTQPTGDATSASLGYRVPVLRTLPHNLFVTLMVERETLREKHRQAGMWSVTKDYHVDTLDLTLDGNKATYHGQYTYRLKSRFGHNQIKPSLRASQGRDTTSGAFNLVSGFIKHQQRWGDQWRSNIDLSGQWSSSNLDDTTRFYLGGHQKMRGYNPGEGLADRGFMANVNVSKRINDQLNVGGFFDWGYIQQRSKNRTDEGVTINARNHYQLSDVGLKARYGRWDDLQVDLSVARALASAPSSHSRTRSGDVRMAISLLIPF